MGNLFGKATQYGGYFEAKMSQVYMRYNDIRLSYCKTSGSHTALLKPASSLVLEDADRVLEINVTRWRKGSSEVMS